jgi:hypothetical protein
MLTSLLIGEVRYNPCAVHAGHFARSAWSWTIPPWKRLNHMDPSRRQKIVNITFLSSDTLFSRIDRSSLLIQIVSWLVEKTNQLSSPVMKWLHECRREAAKVFRMCFANFTCCSLWDAGACEKPMPNISQQILLAQDGCVLLITVSWELRTARVSTIGRRGVLSLRIPCAVLNATQIGITSYRWFPDRNAKCCIANSFWQWRYREIWNNQRK